MATAPRKQRRKVLDVLGWFRARRAAKVFAAMSGPEHDCEGGRHAYGKFKETNRQTISVYAGTTQHADDIPLRRELHVNLERACNSCGFIDLKIAISTEVRGEK